jgi:hypothetical protein
MKGQSVVDPVVEEESSSKLPNIRKGVKSATRMRAEADFDQSYSVMNGEKKPRIKNKKRRPKIKGYGQISEFQIPEEHSAEVSPVANQRGKPNQIELDDNGDS